MQRRVWGLGRPANAHPTALNLPQGCIESIFKRCTDTNRFVNEEARKVVEAMVQHGTTAKVLAMCLSAFTSHNKDPKMRAAIALCICRSIEVCACPSTPDRHSISSV